MINPRVAFLLQCFVFIIPVNIYVIGDWMGAGIQWALFRYQVSYLGESLISFSKEVLYVHGGIIQGRSAIALIIWAAAVFLLLGVFVINLYAIGSGLSDLLNKTFLSLIIAGLLFLVSDIMQYSFSLYSTAGFCIPVGVPIIVIIGIWGYRHSPSKQQYQESGSVQSRNNIRLSRSISLTSISRSSIRKNLTFLITVSIIVKIIVFFSSLYAPFESVTGDISLYYHYASLLASGQLPYIDFPLEYPQLVFIPAIIAYVPTIFFPGFSTYLFSYMILMYLIDAATLICIYFIALHFYGEDKAFVCGMMYTTAIAAAFFIPLTFDIMPTFLLVFALYLYINRKILSAYLTIAAAILTKWFPTLALPCFFIHSIKTKNDIRKTKYGILTSAFFLLILTFPFAILNWQGFVYTYTFHFTRTVETHSFVYYVDAISRLLFQVGYFNDVSLLILVIIEIALFTWYFRFLNNSFQTLSYVIFLSIFFFILFNKVFSASFIIWLTPFLALFLVHSYRYKILFYLTQFIIYIETPLLYRIVFGNGKPYYVIENYFPSFSFVFYTLKFFIFSIVLWLIIRDLKTLQTT